MNTQTPASVAAASKQPRPRPDFIDIQLSDAGIKFAGEGATLSIRRDRLDYTFTGSASVEVLRSEWRSLQKLRTPAGDAVFIEFVPPAPPTPPAAAAATTAAKA